jgi:hypothetical protein
MLESSIEVGRVMKTARAKRAVVRPELPPETRDVMERVLRKCRKQLNGIGKI